MSTKMHAGSEVGVYQFQLESTANSTGLWSIYLLEIHWKSSADLSVTLQLHAICFVLHAAVCCRWLKPTERCRRRRGRKSRRRRRRRRCFTRRWRNEMQLPRNCSITNHSVKTCDGSRINSCINSFLLFHECCNWCRLQPVPSSISWNDCSVNCLPVRYWLCGLWFTVGHVRCWNDIWSLGSRCILIGVHVHANCVISQNVVWAYLAR